MRFCTIGMVDVQVVVAQARATDHVQRGGRVGSEAELPVDPSTQALLFAVLCIGGSLSTTRFIGRRVYYRIESFFIRLPVVKLVYPHVKQVVDLVLGERLGIGVRLRRPGLRRPRHADPSWCGRVGTRPTPGTAGAAGRRPSHHRR